MTSSNASEYSKLENWLLNQTSGTTEPRAYGFLRNSSNIGVNPSDADPKTVHGESAVLDHTSNLQGQADLPEIVSFNLYPKDIATLQELYELSGQFYLEHGYEREDMPFSAPAFYNNGSSIVSVTITTGYNASSPDLSYFMITTVTGPLEDIALSVNG